jgi:hypothetical protein
MRLLEVTAVTTLAYTYYFGGQRSSSGAVGESLVVELPNIQGNLKRYRDDFLVCTSEFFIH